MSHRALPKYPDIDHLKRQAKALLHDAKSADAAALTRMRVLPGFTRVSNDELAQAPFALHDAQSVIAREYGFPSWKALSQHVEELALDPDSAMREFVEAATNRRTDRAARLLKLYPAIAGASFHAALILGDSRRVRQWLAEQPRLAHEIGGPRNWQPLHYVCYNALGHGSITDPDGVVDIVQRLLELGVDPNTRFPWLHHGVRRPVLWGATMVTRSLPLAKALLQAGADANDGVTLPLAASAGDIEALELLIAHGADPNQAWASDGSATLYAILRWATSPAGILWLLEHGAQPDPVFAENGETPLHVVAKRWSVPLAEALVGRGADVSHPRKDGRTPYAVAELNGNLSVADFLMQRGAPTQMEAVDRLVAACNRGDGEAAQALRDGNPGLAARIEPEHYATLYLAAERGDTCAVEALLDSGFDPNRGDEEIGKTALHCAAMAGRVDTVRLLLARGGSPEVHDREFDGTPLVWAADGARSHGGDSADHVEVGRLLLDAGATTEWHTGDEPADALLEILDTWSRRRLERRP